MGLAIAVAIRSFDPSLTTQLIVIQSLEGSLSPSLSARMIPNEM
jgi:hypothetical protein